MDGRAYRAVRWLFVLILALGVIGRADEISEAMRGDAQLADACFVDAACGWAVGDRGAIWHTADAGKHWEPQSSGVDCRLASVFFLDAQIGWAAGGYTQPYGETTTGVVLRTRDGGRHWIADRKLVLPTVERIRFFDATHGWAIGRSSASFPSGVFATDDGGRTWSALPGEESRSWLAGDFVDSNTGALAGRSSTLAVVRRKGVVPRAPDYGLRAFHELKLVAPAKGWLVGDGGLVLKTRDLCNSWQTPDGQIPAAIRDHFDLSALAVRGEHCWIAGTPGTRVLRTADAGRTWSVGDTGQTLPIQHLVFIDEQTGWAVGDLGTILATTDGGHSWRRQQGGGARTAFVGFYSSPSDIPLELIARLSGDDGYLAAMEILNREDVDVRAAPGDAAPAAHEASVLAGGSAASSAWRFPLRQAGLKLSAEQVVDGWNQANDGQAVEKIEAHVVARIRMWRPSVVFTVAADARAGDPLAHLINQIVLRSVERAADPKSYPEQVAEAGLQPWKVQKVYGTLAAGQSGTANVSTAQFAARLGCSIGELAAPARAVVATRYVPPPANVGFRLLVDLIPQELGKRDFFSGIALSPGGEARRRFEDLPDGNLDAMRREAQMRRNLQAILAQAEKGDASDGRFLASIGEQTRTMQPSRAVDVLFQLAERYYLQGRWELAAECFDLIVVRYPHHPLTGRALVWLVQYHASGEAAWRVRAPQQLSVQQVTAQAPIVKRDKDNSFDAEPGEVRQASGIAAAAQVRHGTGLARDLRQTEGRLAKASGYAKQLEQIQPALFAEPTVRFPLAVAQRQQGLPRQAERYFLSLRHSRPHDAWWACAQTEVWLSEPKGQAPKPLWNCARATGKPRLDGRLDEPLWRAGNTVELHSPQRDDAEWGSVVMLAYDDEFLYVGVSCTQAAGFKYDEKSAATRPRDPELADQDRIELLLDVDRDFATYYRLSIDHRGWTGESCWQDPTWNPNWFVATGGDDGTWTAEAAIPLAELTGQPPTSKHVWAAGVQRVVPGVGFQSWTTPAATAIMPEGFGFLIFD
jgi:photosystem II stability/assembly factor-like uncharacterized protein